MPETLVIERELDAPIHRVFAAWTDPVVMASWFYVGAEWSAEVTAQPVSGGAFTVTMRDAEGAEMVSHGVYEEVSAPYRLRFSWNSYAVSDTVVTVELRDLGPRTHLTLTHEGLPSEEALEKHRSGWGRTFEQLAATLRHPG